MKITNTHTGKIFTDRGFLNPGETGVVDPQVGRDLADKGLAKIIKRKRVSKKTRSPVEMLEERDGSEAV